MTSCAVDEVVTAIAKTLPGDDPDAHVFHETREDFRITLGSGGRRLSLTTRSRGSVMAWLDGACTCDGELPHESRADLNGETLTRQELLFEESVRGAAAKVAAGRPQASWLARLVAFEQVVWVARAGTDAVRDVRKGCRVEVRAQIGGDARSAAVEEWVFDPTSSPPIEGMFTRAFDRAETKRGARRIPDVGETTAIFAPGTAGVVAHELIGHALEGDLACQGRSWILNGGIRSGPRKVSVIDDPSRGRGSWRIDDEGTVAQPVRLLDGGVWEGLVLDVGTARALGRRSTGHGRRASHLDRIQPRMGCTYIEAGGDDPSESVSSTKTGVFIRRVSGGHTDPSTGRATFVVEDGDLIEDGALTTPLDSFVIELDGARSWMSIDRVAGDLAFDTCVGSCIRGGQPLAVSVGAPTIRIGLIRVCC